MNYQSITVLLSRFLQLRPTTYTTNVVMHAAFEFNLLLSELYSESEVL